MKALVLRDHKQLRVDDVPDPTPGPNDVLVRVRACGICGSDVSGFDGSTGRRIPPIIMGHEAAGVVEAVGDNVRDLQPGDRVAFDSTVSCGECWYCRREQYNLCDDRRVLGVSCDEYRRDGAFAEYIALPRRIVYRLPDNVSFEQGAMLEPISIAVHAVARTPIREKDTAVVFGCGMIGLLVIQALRGAGVQRIVAADPHEPKLALARQMGAAEVIRIREDDLQDKVRGMTDGRGADIAVDAVGTAASLTDAIAAVRKGGHITLVGNRSPRAELPLQDVVGRELTLAGSYCAGPDFPRCIDLLASGGIDVQPLITATAPLDDGPQWFGRLYSREPGLMKVILQP